MGLIGPIRPIRPIRPIGRTGPTETPTAVRPLAGGARPYYVTPLCRPAKPPSLRERTNPMPRRLACLALLLLAPCAVLGADDPNAVYKLGPDSMEEPDV